MATIDLTISNEVKSIGFNINTEECYYSFDLNLLRNTDLGYWGFVLMEGSNHVETFISEYHHETDRNEIEYDFVYYGLKKVNIYIVDSKNGYINITIEY